VHNQAKRFFELVFFSKQPRRPIKTSGQGWWRLKRRLNSKLSRSHPAKTSAKMAKTIRKISKPRRLDSWECRKQIPARLTGDEHDGFRIHGFILTQRRKDAKNYDITMLDLLCSLLLRSRN
jgi:hypothetical protein